MGNQNTKESRGGERSSRTGTLNPFDPSAASTHGEAPISSRSRRESRLGLLGLTSAGGSGAQQAQHQERRETRQEREARRLEKERVARIKERERSLQEEHVDGGYLVTLGTYSGSEDFNKAIVRQFQIERKLAPFWRGLNDINSQWTEAQIIAAAHGLPIPQPDQTPPDDLVPRPLSAQSHNVSTQNLNNLTVPMNERSQSVASDSKVSPARSASPLKTSRANKVLSVLGGTSRNASTTDIVPREVNLPSDPFVNGQPLEVFLYKNASECPICFLDYPPYLNQSRCCSQPICSECFVQIKRPDPHFPEGHNENDPNHNPEEVAGLLISEPACCPFCQQVDFGVTYEPPPFRRGLVYTVSPSTLGHLGTAMSSNSSLNSANLSPSMVSPPISRRRAHSLSANDPTVITTDRIRPEWASKLQSARNHQARRAAAATALHTAAFLMGGAENRTYRVGRFGRRNNTASSGSGGQNTSSNNNAEGTDVNHGTGAGIPAATVDTPGQPAGPGMFGLATPSAARRSRMDDLEDMMFAEAIRLSLAAEEERKAKEEKEKKKEAKRQEKEARKAAKSAAKQAEPYAQGGPSGLSSASGSSVSLSGFGRKRGNGNTIRAEAGVAGAMNTAGGPGSPDSEPISKDKGKGVDRSLPATIETTDFAAESSGVSAALVEEQSSATSYPMTMPMPITRPGHSPHQPIGPSHLRQMSSASSISSSLPDSQAGSYTSPSYIQDPRSSGPALGNAGEGGAGDTSDPSTSTEPLFNFRSLAAVVGVTLEGENAGRRISRIEAERNAQGEEAEEVTASSKPDEAGEVDLDRVEDIEYVEEVEDAKDIEHVKDFAALPPLRTTGLSGEESGTGLVQPLAKPHLDGISTPPPEVTVTPETPVGERLANDSKPLGYETTTTVTTTHEATQ